MAAKPAQHPPLPVVVALLRTVVFSRGPDLVEPHAVLDPVRPGAGRDVGGDGQRDDLVARGAVDERAALGDREARVVAGGQGGREPDPAARGQVLRRREGGRGGGAPATLLALLSPVAASAPRPLFGAAGPAAAAAEPLADRLEPAEGARVRGLEHDVEGRARCSRAPKGAPGCGRVGGIGAPAGAAAAAAVAEADAGSEGQGVGREVLEGLGLKKERRRV